MGRWDGYKDEQDRGSAFQSLESRKIRRSTEAQLRTDQLEDYTCLSDSVQNVEDREKLLSTRGIWQELFGGKTSSAEVALTVFQEERTA